ncbi:MAG: urease subunit beta [Acidimicrobiales bacterium]
MIPGEIVVGEDPVTINAIRPVTRMAVHNIGDRPIQVGSHYHFGETNAALEFDRESAWGKRLNIPAGTSVRFEPGIEKEIELIPLAGKRIVPGLRRMAGGLLDQSMPLQP